MIKRVITYSDNISALHTTAEGLWIGHQGGLTFFDPAAGTSVSWTTLDGLPAHPVSHIASSAKRLAVATPNGVAWIDDRAAAITEAFSESARTPWHRALMHVRGTGVHTNGVTFVDNKIYATTGGGRVYFEAATGFQLIELPLPQARLLRVLPLPCASHQRRLVIVTNNSGILLLATGKGEEPSLFHWGEDEGLISRYVTAALDTTTHLVVGVHGGLHVARTKDLIERPGEITSWGRIVLSDLRGPGDHTRIHDLTLHGDSMYIATSAGLYQVGTTELELATQDRTTAHRVEEAPVRNLASRGDQLWAVHNNGLGQFLGGTPGTVRSTATSDNAGVQAQRPRITSYGQRWRFLPEHRWRRYDLEPECRHVVTLCSTPAGLALGGDSGRFALLVGERWTTESIARPRRPHDVQSIALDPDSGNMWVATRHGLFQRTSPGRWYRDASFPGRNVHALQVWNDSVLALGSNGLYAFAQGDWNAIAFAGEAPALAVAAVSDNTLAMAGRTGSGLFLWRRNEAQPFRVDASIGRANCLAWDAGRLWIGTDRGLVRWQDDRLEHWSWDDEAENHITALLVHNAVLHVGSQMGIWQAPVDGFASLTGAKLEAAGSRDRLLEGLPHLQVTAVVAHEDEVWVGTQSGLAVLG